MFDVSFSELIVIAVVALIVIGPEKLPKVARTLGALTGRMQRYVAQVKEEVNREVRFQELQQLQQEIQATTTKAQTGLEQKAESFKQDLLDSDVKADTEKLNKETAGDLQTKDRSL
jgi:sec-independent protein translocase protein TatB